jgi:hypothetical protein
MKKITSYLVFFLLIFIQCRKDTLPSPNTNFSGGPYSINGVVMLYDTLNGNYSYHNLSGVTVYLRYKSNPSGYLYSVNANSLGQYSFSGINKDSSYTIYCEKDSNNVRYYNQLNYNSINITSNSASDTLKLYPSSKNQNGIHLIVFDALATRIPNITAWIFTSHSAFNASDSGGKSFNMTTNEYGVANKLNLAPGYYFLRVKTKIGTDSVKGEDSISINDITGIINSIITLKSFPSNKNGFELTIVDEDSTPIYNAKVFCYRSKLDFQLDDSTNADSLFSINSNQSGMAFKYNIDPALYYLRIIKQIGDSTFKKEDSIEVQTNAIRKKQVFLK